MPQKAVFEYETRQRILPELLAEATPRRKFSVERARRAFGFEAQTAIEEGLRSTIARYKTYGVVEPAR